MSDYLQAQVLSRMSEHTREFLRVISVSDPIAVPLASQLSGRADAGRILNDLEHQTVTRHRGGRTARHLPDRRARAQPPPRGAQPEQRGERGRLSATRGALVG